MSWPEVIAKVKINECFRTELSKVIKAARTACAVGVAPQDVEGQALVGWSVELILTFLTCEEFKARRGLQQPPAE